VKRSDNYRALEPFELLGNTPVGWAKNENWRIAKAMKKEDIDGTDLGDILRTV